MQNVRYDDHQWELEKHQLMESVPPVQCSGNELAFDEDAPHEEVADVSVEDLVERPRTQGGVEEPKQNRIEDSVNASENEILLKRAAPERGCDLWSSNLPVCW